MIRHWLTSGLVGSVAYVLASALIGAETPQSTISTKRAAGYPIRSPW
jgi:hypothetical protein